MDKMDYAILKSLRENARNTASTIGKEIHLSVSAVLERIRKMESTGLIKQYTIVVDQEKLGNNMTALMEVSLAHPKYYESFTDSIKNNENIVSCHYVTGDYDLMLTIYCRSAEHLEQVHRMVKGHEGVTSTKTHVVLKTAKNNYCSIPEE
ncbi:MAG: Lrp/AsnC family transcriptional regulator [Lachnospiraceae bacterium]|nr:Lrp/AsnC family transcriptional regulator [Lachnospiraceae bacterium]